LGDVDEEVRAWDFEASGPLFGNPKAPVAAETVYGIVDPFRLAGLTPEVRLRFNRPTIQVSAVLRLSDLLKDAASLVLIIALLATVAARLNDSLPRGFLAEPNMISP
jgi:hypothetical protein